MKQADIKVDGKTVYETKVGADRISVVIVGTIHGTTHDSRKRFVCKRVDNGKRLPKARASSAIHEVKP